jgi:hypothetical protein
MPTIVDGTAGITFPNSTAQASAGQVLQVVQGTFSTSTTTASTSPVSTGISASITPKFSTSRILVIYSGTFYSNAAGRGIRLQITRAGTSIYLANTFNTYVGGADIVNQLNLTVLDSPTTTSSISYVVNFATPQAATVTAQYDNNLSTITLMEIAG